MVSAVLALIHYLEGLTGAFAHISSVIVCSVLTLVSLIHHLNGPTGAHCASLQLVSLRLLSIWPLSPLLSWEHAPWHIIASAVLTLFSLIHYLGGPTGAHSFLVQLTLQSLLGLWHNRMV